MSARWRNRMARACPIKSRNGMTAPLLKTDKLIPHDRFDLAHTQTGINYGNSFRVFARQGQVPFPDPLMKVKRLSLDSVPTRQLCAKPRRGIGVGTFSTPHQSDLRIEIQQDGQVWDQPVSAESVQLLYQIEVDASSKSLVRQRRIGKTVAEHDCPSRERGGDQFPDKLRA